MSLRENRYRTHNCGALRASNEGQEVRLSGWLGAIRDHRGILFADLRDRYGKTQIVFGEGDNQTLRSQVDALKVESTITVHGIVRVRPSGASNAQNPTGEIEVIASKVDIHTRCEQLPFQVAVEEKTADELRLKYRFLDLRREKMQRNIIMRAQIVGFIRRFMDAEGFLDIATPILANSSPEGARDFLVPSRLHPGHFYALPQAPQQFKQLLMVSGFDRYYQIAPCFRDEDARADRSPGEFYQLDLEMAFAEQDDVFDVCERLFTSLTTHFGKRNWKTPFPRYQFDEILDKFGSDKPDLRYGMEINDVTSLFADSPFRVLKGAVDQGLSIRAICAPGAAKWSNSYFKKVESKAKELGAKGLVAVGFGDANFGKGAADKLAPAEVEQLKATLGATESDLVLMVADKPKAASKILGVLRVQLGQELCPPDPDTLGWGWVSGFPMFERNEKTGQVEFGHNPFSMPIGGMETLNSKDPLEIKAYQYDLFCNGLEISSGAVRNFDPEIMYRAFEIAGLPKEEVDTQFGHMLRAFKMGAPPHAGIAPGIERVVMLITGEPTLREVVPFPKNQQAQDLMLNAPSRVRPDQLEEVHIRIVEPPAKS